MSFSVDNWRRSFDRDHGRDWWRRHNDFRNYSGFRTNFYYAPSYGYYRVPSQYWNRDWYAGQYLPNVFWRYIVTDWAWYGLPSPPWGCEWVYVDNDMYLVDMYDGYIIDAVYRAWYW